MNGLMILLIAIVVLLAASPSRSSSWMSPVSYTHLTLPTKA